MQCTVVIICLFSGAWGVSGIDVKALFINVPTGVTCTGSRSGVGGGLGSFPTGTSDGEDQMSLISPPRSTSDILARCMAKLLQPQPPFNMSALRLDPFIKVFSREKKEIFHINAWVLLFHRRNVCQIHFCPPVLNQ